MAYLDPLNLNVTNIIATDAQSDVVAAQVRWRRSIFDVDRYVVSYNTPDRLLKNDAIIKTPENGVQLNRLEYAATYCVNVTGMRADGTHSDGVVQCFITRKFVRDF